MEVSKPIPPADSARLRLSAKIHKPLGSNTKARDGTAALAFLSEPLIYSNDDIAVMAKALNVSVERVQAHRVALEHSARQYKRRRRALSEREARAIRKRLEAIEKACRKVLALLYIDTPEAAEDGIGSPEKSADVACGGESLTEALQTAIEEDELRQVVWSVGRLTIAAARAIDLQKAPEQQDIDTADVARIEGLPTNADAHVRLAVRGGLRRHGGDIHLGTIAADLLRIYESITHKPAALTKAVGDRMPRLYGKCLDFVQAALTPVKATITADQLDSMIDHAKQLDSMRAPEKRVRKKRF